MMIPHRFIATLAFSFLLLALALFIRDRETISAKEIPKQAAYRCLWVSSPLVMDGSLEEAAWKQAGIIDSFALPWLGNDARSGKEKTAARLLWDRDYLYFACEMEDADLFADELKHDGVVWENDTFELFFRPASDKPGYFEFEVNAAGTTLDAFFPKYNPKDGAQAIATGNFHIDAKIRLRGTLNQRNDVDRGWTVEGRIPWTDFLRAGGRPEMGETWMYSLCRCNYHKDWNEPDLSTTAAITEKKIGSFFHQIDDYSPIQFVGPGGATQPIFGIDQLVPVTSSTVVGSPDPPFPYRVVRAYPDFRPDRPIMAKPIPGSDEMLIVLLDRPSSATSLHRFPDVPDVKNEQMVKLLDVPENGTATDFCFHPKFAENGYLYIGWYGKYDGKIKDRAGRITRYTMTRKPPYTIDATSAKDILLWESAGHTGCAVCFGLDGMMYVTTGDGTSDSDTDETGQRTDLLLAKLLRIDVDHPVAGKMYSVPKDNPYVNDPRFVPETWAYGFRNPWRMDCDAKTGEIWVAQNGQDLWEQAYLVSKGANYGWSVTEGSHPFYKERKAGPTPILPPTVEHSHAEARSLTGGIVYYGSKPEGLNGTYVYGDYSTGRIWGAKCVNGKRVYHEELARTTLSITGFSKNTRGELLVFDHDAKEGGLYRFEPTPKDLPPSTFPRKLSESGLFDSVKDHRMKPGIIPYSVNTPFWSDGMYKERWMALPPNTTIEYRKHRGWNFPDKTVLIKSFGTAPGKWVETRFFTRQDGEWYGYTYQWNAEGTDAELVGDLGTDQEVLLEGKPLKWRFPSRAECMVCHSRAANFVLGVCDGQMNKLHDYGNGRIDNQLRVLDHLGLIKVNWDAELRTRIQESGVAKGLKNAELNAYIAAHAPQRGQRSPPPNSIADQTHPLSTHFVDPYDPSLDLTTRAKSWIQSNCASCHVEAGGGNAQMKLEFRTPLDAMKIINEKPVHFTFNLADPKLISPGNPDASILFMRMSTRGQYQMPPIATHRVDEQGVALLREWIKSLPTQQPDPKPKP